MLQNNTECGTAFTSYYKADTSYSASFEAINNATLMLTDYIIYQKTMANQTALLLKKSRRCGITIIYLHMMCRYKREGCFYNE